MERRTSTTWRQSAACGDGSVEAAKFGKVRPPPSVAAATVSLLGGVQVASLALAASYRRPSLRAWNWCFVALGASA